MTWLPKTYGDQFYALWHIRTDQPRRFRRARPALNEAPGIEAGENLKNMLFDPAARDGVGEVEDRNWIGSAAHFIAFCIHSYTSAMPWTATGET